MDWPAYSRQIAVEEGHPAPDIFVRQIQAECSWSEDVIYCRRFSSAGAQGIAQIMPGTAAGWGVDPCNPEEALRAAARAMTRYYAQYGDWAVALAAYNAGPGNVAQYGGVPPFEETKRYIAAILGSSGGSSSPETSNGTGSSNTGGTLILLGALALLLIVLN